MPISGQDFSAVIWHCGIDDCLGFEKMTGEAPNLAVCLGDWDYYDNAGIDLGTNPDTYRALLLTALNTQLGRAAFVTSCPNINMWDNHEALGTQAAPPHPDTGLKTANYLAAYQALYDYTLGLNPINVDPNIHTMPSIYGAPGPAPYFRYTMGDVEFICMDQISWAEDRGTTGSSAKTRLGYSADPQGATKQLDWVVARIAGSSANVIVICSPSQPVIAPAAGNTEWVSILNAINSSPKTVILMTGDSHGYWVGYRPQNMATNPANLFSERGLVEVMAGPLQQTSFSGGDSLQTGTAQVVDSGLGGTARIMYPNNYNYAVIERQASVGRTVIRCKLAQTGAQRSAFYVRDGERKPNMM